jgi:hypothetical protein
MERTVMWRNEKGRNIGVAVSTESPEQSSKSTTSGGQSLEGECDFW